MAAIYPTPPPPPAPLSSPSELTYRLIVARKKTLPEQQQRLELSHNNKREFHESVHRLVSATASSHDKDKPDLDMFLRQAPWVSESNAFALFNGPHGPTDSLSHEGKFLLNCSFEVFCCLGEHLIKKTAGSMDISDLREYANTAPPGGRKMSNVLRGILRNGDNDTLLSAFIERAKSTAGIKSFVKQS